MSDTMPYRTATAAELADHAARTERARTGRQLPRTLHALCEQSGRLVDCGHCWARPGTPCVSGPDGYHLARFARAYRRGLLTGPEFTGLIADGDVFTGATVIRDGEQ